MNAETALMREIQLEACKDPNVRLFRNNVGVLIDRNGRPVQFGLAVGSSDLIGLESVVVGPEMIGRTIAVFTAIEVKTASGKATPAQTNFLAMVERHGGTAILARSVNEYLDKKKERGPLLPRS